MACGAIAGGLSVFVSHPIDTVKSNVQSLDAGKYSGLVDCGMQIVRSDGVAGLFRGMGPRFVRVCIEVGLQFMLYEQYGRILDGYM